MPGKLWEFDGLSGRMPGQASNEELNKDSHNQSHICRNQSIDGGKKETEFYAILWYSFHLRK